MSGFMYEIARPETETSDRLEKGIASYAKNNKVRMPRARRQLIEKGLAVVETEVPDMTEGEKRVFREKIKRLYSLVSEKKQDKEVKKNEKSFT